MQTEILPHSALIPSPSPASPRNHLSASVAPPRGWDHAVFPLGDGGTWPTVMSSGHIVPWCGAGFPFFGLHSPPLCVYGTFALSIHLLMDVWVASSVFVTPCCAAGHPHKQSGLLQTTQPLRCLFWISIVVSWLLTSAFWGLWSNLSFLG